MRSVVVGDLVPLGNLSSITDWATVKKASLWSSFAAAALIDSRVQYYKLNGEPALKAVAQDQVQERRVIEEIVISSVAMKSVAA